MTELIAALSVLVAAFALLLNWYNSGRAYGTRRRKIINAVYYHVEMAIDSLQELRKSDDAIRQKIKNDESYTPYVPSSPNDDLSYGDVIEVMEWLDLNGQQAMSYYWHYQAGLHALAQSFELEFIRNWPPSRKLGVWEAHVQYREQTIKYAEEAKQALEPRIRKGFKDKFFKGVKQTLKQC